MPVSNELTRPDLPVYFGEFGGILIPDAFTPDVLHFAEEAEALVQTEAFSEAFSKALSFAPAEEIRKETLYGRTFYIVPSRALYYMTAGHIALASLRGTAFNQIGTTDAKIAKFAADACEALGIGLSATLGTALSDDEDLGRYLAEKGVSVDRETCGKLYDRPQAYAFQKYLGNRAESSFIPVGQALGPYPFTALTGLFGGQWGKALRAAMPEVPEAAAATMLQGNAALSVFRAFPECRKITVERPVPQEYHGEFCGASLLMVRPSADHKYAVPLAPEVTDGWRMAEIVRLGAGDYSEAEGTDGISSDTVRAAALIAKRLPELSSVLLVEGQNE